MNRDVVVVIGAGGIGQATARRQGAGRSVLLADFNENTLQTAAAALKGAGCSVSTQHVDVSSRESVRALAETATALGSVVQVAHTAGVSPMQAPPARVLAVDLLGTALVLEEFGRVIAPGGAGIVISSMAGYMPAPLDPAHAEALAHTATDELLQLPILPGGGGPKFGSCVRPREARQSPARAGGQRPLGRPRRPRQLHQPWHCPDAARAG